MNIFQKKPIEVGDIVIGVAKYGWDSKGAALLERYFTSPSLVLEIKDDEALVFFEQSGPRWYNLSKLERCYVKEEFENQRAVAIHQQHSGDKRGD